MVFFKGQLTTVDLNHVDPMNTVLRTTASAHACQGILELMVFVNVSTCRRCRMFAHDIRKTCPCNVYPLEPHFYIVKLGYAGVYLFFLFLPQNIDCGYSLEPPRRGGSNLYPQSMF